MPSRGHSVFMLLRVVAVACVFRGGRIGRRAARSVHARPRRRAVGRADAEEADAGREDRPADRPVVRVEFPEHRQRHVRDADAAGARVPRRRLSRVRRVAAGAVGAAELRLRHGDSRPAVFGGVPHQPAAGDVGGAAAEHRRLRDRRRLPHLRRDQLSAADGDGRDSRSGRPAAGARGSADHRDRIARARRAGELRAGRRRQQQPAQSGDQHPLLRRGSRAGRRAGRRLRRRRARRPDDRDDQAFSRARRHRRRQPSRPAGDHLRSRAARRRSSCCRSAAAWSRAPRR